MDQANITSDPTTEGSSAGFIIIAILSIVISILDIGIDVGDGVADALTGDVAGLGTSIIDIISEFGLEIAQVFLTVISIYVLENEGDSDYSKGTRIAIVVGLAIVDIVLSFVGFLPYFDIIEIIAELVSEIIQNYFLYV